MEFMTVPTPLKKMCLRWTCADSVASLDSTSMDLMRMSTCDLCHVVCRKSSTCQKIVQIGLSGLQPVCIAQNVGEFVPMRFLKPKFLKNQHVSSCLLV